MARRVGRATLERRYEARTKEVESVKSERDGLLDHNARLRNEVRELQRKMAVPPPSSENAHLFYLVFTHLADLIETQALAVEIKSGEGIQEYHRKMQVVHDVRKAVSHYSDMIVSTLTVGGFAVADPEPLPEPPLLIEILNAITPPAVP